MGGVMMRRMIAVTGLMMLVLATGLAAAGTQTQAQTKAMGGALDGMKWSVKVAPDAMAAGKGEKAFDDVIVADAGRVTMSECLKWGFKPSKYTTEPAGSGLAFRTEQTSKKEGTSVWTGEIAGDKITGKMVWTKKDGTVLNYTFEGRKAGT
jgi:hypothetical protein